jgi:amino acid transporter
VSTNVYSIYTLPPLDIATTLAPATGYPIINLFYATTKSLAASNVMTTVIVFNLAAGTIAALAAASRQLWAFARNGGLPFSRFFAPVRALFSASRIG